MAGGSAIRGSRVGAGPMGEAERGEAAPRRYVSFYCADGHGDDPELRRRGQYPGDLGLPELRIPRRPRSGQSAYTPKIEPYKTHLAYVKERRSTGDGDQILAEALQRVRGEDL